MKEFFNYAMTKRASALTIYKGYDQGYYSIPKPRVYILELGTVSILTASHCCMNNSNGPKSVKKLSDYFRIYGIEVDKIEKNQSSINKQLSSLGLVLDNPDADSGMLLKKPF